MSLDQTHIRHCMLYEFKKGSSATEAARNIRSVYGNEALSVRTCQRWFGQFRSGNFSLEDSPRSGRPSSVNIELLQTVVEENPKQTARELAKQFNTSHTSIIKHLHELGKVSKLGQWVPHHLTASQLNQRVALCSSLKSRLATEPFLGRIITSDEKWVLYNHIQRKRQWLAPNEKGESIPKPGLHPKKVMLCVWWDMKGVVYHEVLNQNETVNAEKYCRQLEALHKNLQKKRPSLVNRKGVLLLHDNARPHIARVTQEKIMALNMEVLPHPPYSPDLAPSDYHLFRSLQHFLEGKQFINCEEVKTDIECFFASKPEEFYARGIKNLPNRWDYVIDNEGKYYLD